MKTVTSTETSSANAQIVRISTNLILKKHPLYIVFQTWYWKNTPSILCSKLDIEKTPPQYSVPNLILKKHPLNIVFQTRNLKTNHLIFRKLLIQWREQRRRIRKMRRQRFLLLFGGTELIKFFASLWFEEMDE